MGRINSSNNLGRRGGLSNASPFVRFAAGFSGLAPQLLDQERKFKEALQKRQEDQQKERQKQLDKSFKLAEKTLGTLTKNLAGAKSEEELAEFFQLPSTPELLGGIREGFRNGGLSDAAVNSELSQSISAARANFAGAAGERTGDTAVADLEAKLDRKATDAERKILAGVAKNPNLVLREINKPNGDEALVVIDLAANDGTGAIVRELARGPSVQTQLDELPGATAKEVEALEGQEIAVRDFVGAADDLKKIIIQGGPAALSASGGIARAYREGVSLFRGLAQIVGADTTKLGGKPVGDTIGQFDSDGKPLDLAAKTAETIFDRLGVAASISAAIKSDIVNLAFAAAAASGQTGRAVSDRDYKNFVTQLAGGVGDPATFTGIIDRVTTRINRNFRNTFRVKAGSGRFPGLSTDRIPDPLSEFRASQAQAAQPARISTPPDSTTGDQGFTAEDFGGIGAPVAVNPVTGDRVRLNLETGTWDPI